MAKIEVNRFLASSKDNFLVFSNNNYEKPYVTFYFRNGQNPIGELKIKDALDDDGYSKTMKYSPDEIITDSSFRCTANKTENTFSLLECLRKNVIFYNIQLIADVPNVGMIIKAYIDSSTRYNISASSILVIGGTYSSFTPRIPNKYTLLINDGDNQIVLEKHTMAEDVSFNVTAPFEHLTFKDPIDAKMLAYHIEDNKIVPDTIAQNSVVVLPTTLPKFSDVELGDYFYSYNGQKVNFLTNNFNRYYNYGEICALSVLTDKSSVSLKKKYYTISGKYLGEDSVLAFLDSPFMRRDFYFDLSLNTIEAQTNKQVGYVDVVAVYNGSEITKPIRYNIVPKCNQNNEIFFVNELGGIDSFNFLGERTYETKIDDQITYFKNPTRKFGMTKELELVSQKKNKVEHTLKSAIINTDTALWLNEMSKSKYAFLFHTNKSKFERIIITDMDIDVSDRDNTFEVELTYQTGDSNISF